MASQEMTGLVEVMKMMMEQVVLCQDLVQIKMRNLMLTF
jgi:hypothetical protein